jgi:hypothetical protein
LGAKAKQALAGAADQFQILVAHPHHQLAVFEIARLAGADLLVYLEHQSLARIPHLQLAAPRIARDTESLAAEPPERGHPVGAR